MAVLIQIQYRDTESGSWYLAAQSEFKDHDDYQRRFSPWVRETAAILPPEEPAIQNRRFVEEHDGKENPEMLVMVGENKITLRKNLASAAE